MPYFIPKSDRLNLPDALPPQRSFPVPCAGMHLKRSIVRLTGFVTPSSVRLPSIADGLSPVKTNFVDLYVIFGNSATLKKSAARRCSSRERVRDPFSWSPVSTGRPPRS